MGNGYTTNRAVSLGDELVALAETMGSRGVTVAELDARYLGIHHHGTISGSLSNLHRDKRLALLTEKRGRSRVYVHPEFVNGREHTPQGRNHLANIAA